MGVLSRDPHNTKPGISPALIAPLATPKPHTPERKVVHEVISGYRETMVIDTPMRKFSVLETQDGSVMLRDIDFTLDRSKADVTWLHLERAQGLALAAVLRELDDAPPTNGNGKARP